MAYTPTTWVTGDTVTATKMNKIENGIADSGGALVCNTTYSNDYGCYALDKTAQEIYDALNAGEMVVIKYVYGTPETFYSGTTSFANVVRFSNYNYTETLSIYAVKCTVVTVGGNYGAGAPTVIRYIAEGLDDFPHAPLAAQTNANSLTEINGDG